MSYEESKGDDEEQEGFRLGAPITPRRRVGRGVRSVPVLAELRRDDSCRPSDHGEAHDADDRPIKRLAHCGTPVDCMSSPRNPRTTMSANTG